MTTTEPRAGALTVGTVLTDLSECPVGTWLRDRHGEVTYVAPASGGPGWRVEHAPYDWTDHADYLLSHPLVPERVARGPYTVIADPRSASGDMTAEAYSLHRIASAFGLDTSLPPARIADAVIEAHQTLDVEWMNR